jgi:hypothetical protein
MTTIASKNIYELLGNDPELDPNRPADPPTKAIDKPVARAGKRDGPDSKAPVERVGNARPKQTANATDQKQYKYNNTTRFFQGCLLSLKFLKTPSLK